MSPFRILTGKPTGKRTLGRPWRRRENNIRINIKEIYCWTAIVNTALNLWEP